MERLFFKTGYYRKFDGVQEISTALIRSNFEIVAKYADALADFLPYLANYDNLFDIRKPIRTLWYDLLPFTSHL